MGIRDPIWKLVIMFHFDFFMVKTLIWRTSLSFREVLFLLHPCECYHRIITNNSMKNLEKKSYLEIERLEDRLSLAERFVLLCEEREEEEEERETLELLREEELELVLREELELVLVLELVLR